MQTTRLETFADGVMAVAATLLIFDVDTALPPGLRGGLGHRLLDAWPSYLAYAVSFLTIGVIWVNHHTIMSQVGRADRLFLFLNVGLLMSVAFIPFPTRLVAEHFRAGQLQPAALLYGITMSTMAIFFQAVWRYACRGGLLRAGADPRVLSGITRSFRPGVPIYVGATLIALLSPTVSVCLYAALTLLYMVESSLFGDKTTSADSA